MAFGGQSSYLYFGTVLYVEWIPGDWGGVGGRHRARAAGEEAVETALSTGRDWAADTAAQLTAGKALWWSAAVPGGAAARLPLPGGQLLHQLPGLHITAGQAECQYLGFHLSTGKLRPPAQPAGGVPRVPVHIGQRTRFR